MEKHSHIAPASLENLTRFNQETHLLTIEALQIALLSLLKIKPLKRISISELTRLAGVSRNAFYRNFKSKEALLQTILGQVTDTIKPDVIQEKLTEMLPFHPKNV